MRLVVGGHHRQVGEPVAHLHDGERHLLEEKKSRMKVFFVGGQKQTVIWFTRNLSRGCAAWTPVLGYLFQESRSPNFLLLSITLISCVRLYRKALSIQ